ncbi:MAG: hypothetical protein AAF682_21300 [Planctomycetota bacterium]
MNVRVQGPFWQADIEAVRWAEPAEDTALRALFVQSGSDAAVHELRRVPGTLLLLGRPRSVQAQLANEEPAYEWEAGDDAPASAGTVDEVRQALRTGELALLLVATDAASPAELEERGATCLAGDIHLTSLRAAKSGGRDAEERLLSALELGAKPLAERYGEGGAPTVDPGRLLSLVSFNASGLSVFGTTVVPWGGGEALAAPFLLTRGAPGAGFRLDVELDRLTAGEHARLLAAWSDLADLLNPKGAGSPLAAPTWVTLEVGSRDVLPQMFWHFQAIVSTPAIDKRPAAARPTLHFDAGRSPLFHLLLTDRTPFDPKNPPETLARVTPSDVTIETVQDADLGEVLRVSVEAASEEGDAPRPDAGQLSFAWSATDGSEAYRLSPLMLAYDALSTPHLLREIQGLPVPEFAPGENPEPVSPAAVWSYMPLADGWAELPVPNLTEQIYLDAELGSPLPSEQPEQGPPPLLQGAVAYDNEAYVSDAQGVRRARPEEQAWSLTLTGCSRVSGTWMLKAADGSKAYELHGVELALDAPRIVVDGLLWLSTDRPTRQDALPTLDDWRSGLVSIPLRTLSERGSTFPPLVRFELEQLSFSRRSADAAELGAWSFQLAYDKVLLARAEAGGGAGVLPAGFREAYRPWFWRRHPTLPMVQALPLTQNQEPPNHPSSSRQLLPFEQPRGTTRWRFGLLGEAPVRGAASWPALLGAGDAAPKLGLALFGPASGQGDGPGEDPARLHDLPLAALSLPGLTLATDESPSPLAPAPGFPLPLQYRHDLPYADEIQALAQLPKPADDEEEGEAAPDATPAQPLTRETFPLHWHELSTRASLAAADAVDALVEDDDGNASVAGLVEPRLLPASPSAAVDAYPGELTLADGIATLSGDGALEGVSGAFVPHGDGALRPAGSAANPFVLTAGSLHAHAEPGAAGEPTFYADQRGLRRAATEVTAAAEKRPALARTPVRMRVDADGPELALALTSTLAAVQLDAAGAPWRLWFRDLPFGGTGAATFDRELTLSARAEDVNDPEGRSRGHDVLQGYEWRLGHEEADGDEAFLPLLGLRFYPLVLAEAQLADDESMHVERLEVVGRLQLPAVEAREEVDGSNAVRLVFEDAGQGLTLTGAEVEAPHGADAAGDSPGDEENEWPLEAERGSARDATRLRWRGLSYDADAGELTVDAVLRFVLFGTPWEVALEGPLTFGPAWPVQASRTLPVADDASESVLLPQSVALTLDEAGVHAASLTVRLRVGEPKRPLLSADAVYPLLGAAPPALVDPTLFASPEDGEGLRIGPADEGGPAPELEVRIDETAIQASWSRGTSDKEWMLFPGATLDLARCPGFAGVALAAVPSEAQGSDLVPTLVARSAYAEVVLACRWGASLQDRADAAPTRAEVFGSSAGDLSIGHTLSLEDGVWTASWLLNGFLSITNLISWPKALAAADGAPDELVLQPVPAPAEGPALDHVRHTMRVMLNQHDLPLGSLAAGSGSTLYRFGEGSAWQLLAVVEHQLVDVGFDADGTPRLTGDRRWTALQRVDLFEARGFQHHLKTLVGARAQGPIGARPYGLLGDGARQLVVRAVQELGDEREDMMLVDASAPHWIRRSTVGAASFSALQFLPGGTQQGILSSPDEYGPSDPADPDWLLLTLPFLGRLQDTRADALPEGDVDRASPLRVDPIQLLSAGASGALALALTSFAEPGAEARTIGLAPIDTAAGRTWARLDPASLDENWLRMQAPPAEAAEIVGLPSVLAALPDTPARLGRSAALTNALRAFRPLAGAEPDASSTPEDAVEAARAIFDAPLRADDGSADEQPNLIENPTFAGKITKKNIPILGAESRRTIRLGPWTLRFGQPKGPATIGSKLRLNPRKDGDDLLLSSTRTTIEPSEILLAQTVTLDEAGMYRFQIQVQPADDARPQKGATLDIHAIAGGEDALFSAVPGDPQAISAQVDFEGAAGAKVEVQLVITARRVEHAWRVSAPSVRRLGEPAPAGWYPVAAQLRALAGGASEVRRHAAATVLAVPALTAVPSDRWPLCFAVPPYLGVAFEAAPSGETPRGLRMMSAELLCLDEISQELAPTATHAFEGEGVELAAVRDVARAWGEETARRLAPQASFSVLRFRQIFELGGGADGAPRLGVAYEFQVLTPPRPAALARRVLSLRSPVRRLRFREGQFGGSLPPSDLRPFELAPPRTVGVQPLYLTAPPDAETSRDWPFGWSGLRFSVEVLGGATGIVGTPKTEGANGAERWWQASQHAVQFRSALSEDRPAAGLPKDFRARPILSLLPAVAPPLPELAQDGEWQPVLPGGTRLLVHGARAGVPFAFRHQVLRQRTGSAEGVLVSGSVPVQHRMPRPVALPPNRLGREEVALRPWASAFAAEEEVSVTHSPLDEAFFAADGAAPARRANLLLRQPVRGEIPADWDGRVDFRLRLEGGVLPTWLKVELSDDARTFELAEDTSADRSGLYTVVEPDKLRAYLRSVRPGHGLRLDVRVGDAEATDGYEQTLCFPLRVTDAKNEVHLPLEPHFLFFEDPEYNRRLASTPANATGQVSIQTLPLPAEPATGLVGVTLATDRREYDPESSLAFRYDWEGDLDMLAGDVVVKRIDSTGLETTLASFPATAAGTLQQLSLIPAAGAPSTPPKAIANLPKGVRRLVPGDVLQLELTVRASDAATAEGRSAMVVRGQTVALQVDVVADPVVPVPEAAYALLRSQREETSSHVECVRFAWGPSASRVELTCPDDLRAGLVRRRAVFRWIDTARPLTDAKYAVQKIAKNGSTHVPNEFYPRPVTS